MSSRRGLLGGMGLAAAGIGTADAATENPFATHKLALQLSDESPAKHREVLDNANTVLKVWPNTSAIVIVAFSGGVGLLYAGSPLRKRVDSLIAQNVEFDICMNSINTITRKTGKTPLLNPKAGKVLYGVPRLMELAAKGYVIVRP